MFGSCLCAPSAQGDFSVCLPVLGGFIYRFCVSVWGWDLVVSIISLFMSSAPFLTSSAIPSRTPSLVASVSDRDAASVFPVPVPPRSVSVLYGAEVPGVPEEAVGCLEFLLPQAVRDRASTAISSTVITGWIFFIIHSPFVLQAPFFRRPVKKKCIQTLRSDTLSISSQKSFIPVYSPITSVMV